MVVFDVGYMSQTPGATVYIDHVIIAVRPGDPEKSDKRLDIRVLPSCLSWGLHTRHRTGLRPAAPQEPEDTADQSQAPSLGAQMRSRTEIM